MPIDLAHFKGSLARTETGTQLQGVGIIITKLIHLPLLYEYSYFVLPSKYPRYN